LELRKEEWDGREGELPPKLDPIRFLQPLLPDGTRLVEDYPAPLAVLVRLKRTDDDEPGVFQPPSGSVVTPPMVRFWTGISQSHNTGLRTADFRQEATDQLFEHQRRLGDLDLISRREHLFTSARLQGDILLPEKP